MITSNGMEPASTWEVSIDPLSDAGAPGRMKLLDLIRPHLEQHIAQHKDARDYTLATPLGPVRARLVAGRPKPGALVKLTVAPDRPISSASGLGSKAAVAYPTLRLPDDSTGERGSRLVGLDHIADEVMMQFECLWDGVAERWSADHGVPVPAAYAAYLRNAGSTFIFSGPPGVGKSALAPVIGNAYCAKRGIVGTVIWLTTEARGTGVVNDFGNKVRSVVSHLASLPSDELKLLIVDEGDSIAMRRSEHQAHQEDRNGTNTLIQVLDQFAGTRRFATVLTTNILDNVDAAIQRRAIVYKFEKAGQPALRALLGQWSPHLAARDIGRAAHAARGMSPADLEKCLSGLWGLALRDGAGITPALACRALSAASRTGHV